MRGIPILAVGGAGLALNLFCAAAHAEGDLVLGRLIDPQVYARAGGIAAISVGTISCNAGDKVLLWRRLPNNKHPVISMNLYRLMDGRMEQIGQSWVKHGFAVASGNTCLLGCRPTPDPSQNLGIGCSDPYSGDLNEGENLRPRAEINATTGSFDGTAVNIPLPQIQTPIDRGLQVREADLVSPNARYFIEGHYIHPEDAESGNGNNNASYREVKFERLANGNFAITTSGQTIMRRPAIKAWEGADFVNIDAPEAKVGNRDLSSRVIVASKVVQVDAFRHRYEYAVHNVNSERGIRSFSVPIGSLAADKISSIGFKAVLSHGQPWSNDPWQAKVENNRVTWSTKTHAEDPNANAIRWGTTYNFWFDAMAAPIEAPTSLGRFKPGQGPEMLPALIESPGRPVTP